MLRKTISLFLMVILMFTIVNSSALAETTPNEVTLSDATVTTFGRTYYAEDGLHMNWTASGFAFTFTGTAVTMDVTASATAGQAFLRVYVDGVALDRDLAISNRSYTVRLVNGLDDTTHTVKVLKRTENGWGGMVTVHKLNVTGTMGTPPARSKRLVEVIGDSITGGYGNLLGNKAPINSYSATRQDGLSTYATLAIEPFGADMQIISRSGIGFGCNNGGGKTDTMLDAYDCTDYFNLGANVKWDFTARKADVVIIALGTNDTANSDLVDYKDKAYKMLQLVRAKNPNAYIIWAYEIMTTTNKDILMQVCNELDDGKIFYHAMPLMDKQNPGDAGHPSMASHIAASEGLSELIGDITGWEPVGPTDQEVANAVISLIEALNVQSLDDEPAVVAAREAYTALSDAQKAYVTNLDKLKAAEQAIQDLKGVVLPVEPNYGDVNGDGVVSAADALEVLKSVVGKVTLTGNQSIDADTDGNGKADAADALNILKKVVGKIEKFPVEE